MNVLKLCFTIMVLVVFSGCATAEFLTGSTVGEAEIVELHSKVPGITLLVKRSDGHASTLLEGVEFVDFKGRAKTNFGNFFETASEIQNGDLLLAACDVRTLTNMLAGQQLRGCNTLHSKVTKTPVSGGYKIELQPVFHRLEEGRTSSLIQQFVKPPTNISTEDWTKYISAQKLSRNFTFQSSYPSESLRANFDQLLRRVSNQKTDGATRQYQATYSVPLSNGATSTVSVDIVPYRNGSRIETLAQMRLGEINNGVANWIQVTDEVEAKLKAIVDR